MTNVCFAEAIKLGYGNEDQLGNQICHAPLNGNRFGFQRMDDKVKDNEF